MTATGCARWSFSRAAPCGACQRGCPEATISLVDGDFVIDRSQCRNCLRCVDVCYAESKELVGREMDVDTVFKEIYKDRIYYELYGGGVTFSGGELLTAITEKCRRFRINTAIETCGPSTADWRWKRDHYQQPEGCLRTRDPHHRAHACHTGIQRRGGEYRRHRLLDQGHSGGQRVRAAALSQPGQREIRIFGQTLCIKGHGSP